MKKIIALLTLAIPAIANASSASTLRIAVENRADFARREIVAIDAAKAAGRLGHPSHLLMTDSSGSPIATQTTHDGSIIFCAEVGPAATAVYTLRAADCVAATDTVVWGAVYPERADDLAWENQWGGYRVYGPATQRAGEKAYGYDLFFKHPSTSLIVPQLYAAQTSPDNWHKVDSLRHIDKALADEFQHSFTYHVDHGLGMDCYAVGATLGAGSDAVLMADTLQFAGCYSTAEILDNGPLRFTVRLDFPPRRAGNCPDAVEHRLITLDACSRLNHTLVWIDGPDSPVTLAAGFPLRDDSPVAALPDEGIIAYADPTQGSDNGKALLGLISTHPATVMRTLQGHTLALTPLAHGEKMQYYWGFAWNRDDDFPDLPAWTAYLKERSQSLKSPLIITID